MKAWVVRELGTPETLRFEDVAAGQPADGMVRIKLHASSINYFDSLMVAGQYQVKPELPFVPGSEISGVVESAPPGSSLKAGDRERARGDNGGPPRGGSAGAAAADR